MAFAEVSCKTGLLVSETINFVATDFIAEMTAKRPPIDTPPPKSNTIKLDDKKSGEKNGKKGCGC
jgi:hypothetical protein